MQTEVGSGDSHAQSLRPCDFVRSQLRSEADRGISSKRGAEVDAPFSGKRETVGQGRDQKAARDQ